MEIGLVIAVTIFSYLIGSINSSILISRMVSGKDIRESGSGNAGATNMLRTMGKKYAVITLVIDILKGVIAVLAARLTKGIGMPDYAAYMAGVAVVIGHNFPLFFGFKGGKGVATSLGVVLMLDWQVGVIVLITALLIMAVTRYVSLGSIVAAICFAVLEPVQMARTHMFTYAGLVCVIILAVLLIARHHANIGRLLKGTENKLGAKKEKK